MKHHQNSILRQIMVFCTVGGTAFLVDVSILTGLIVIGLAPFPARIPAVAFAITTTWLLNRRFTFRTTSSPTWSEYWRYFSAMLIGLMVNLSVYGTLIWTSTFLNERPQVAAAMGVLTAMFVNFISSRKILTSQKKGS